MLAPLLSGVVAMSLATDPKLGFADVGPNIAPEDCARVRSICEDERNRFEGTSSVVMCVETATLCGGVETLSKRIAGLPPAVRDLVLMNSQLFWIQSDHTNHAAHDRVAVKLALDGHCASSWCVRRVIARARGVGPDAIQELKRIAERAGIQGSRMPEELEPGIPCALAKHFWAAIHAEHSVQEEQIASALKRWREKKVVSFRIWPSDSRPGPPLPALELDPACSTEIKGVIFKTLSPDYVGSLMIMIGRTAKGEWVLSTPLNQCAPELRPRSEVKENSGCVVLGGENDFVAYFGPEPDLALREVRIVTTENTSPEWRPLDYRLTAEPRPGRVLWTEP